MKCVTNLFRGKSVSLEKGLAKFYTSNELFLHRDESRTKCSRFVQIVKVIVCIELTILIGWLGCVSFPYYNTDRNTGCGASAIGCKASEIVYDGIGVENSRRSTSVEDTEDGREKCKRIVNATIRRVDNLAAQFVAGESSDPTVLELRRNFTELTIVNTIQLAVIPRLIESFFKQFRNNKTTTTTNTIDSRIFARMPNDVWQRLMENVSEEFVNSTDSQNRPRLEARGPPTGEMASEFRAVIESFYIVARNCDRHLVEPLLPVRKPNKSVENTTRRKRESEPVNQLTIDCRDAGAQLLKERLERLEALAADVANDRFIFARTRFFMHFIELALNATSPSEVTVEDVWLQNDRALIPWKRFMSDASLHLKKEFYELVRDNHLELRHKYNQSSAWEDFDFGKDWTNWTDGLNILTESRSPRTVLNLTITYGKRFNLHYVEAKREDSSIDLGAPAFGTFAYLDAEPEKPTVRRMRNILNGFVRLYFRVVKRLGPCQPAAGETPTSKTFFIPNLVPTLPPMRGFRKKQLARLEQHRTKLKALAAENTTSSSMN